MIDQDLFKATGESSGRAVWDLSSGRQWWLADCLDPRYALMYAQADVEGVLDEFLPMLAGNRAHRLRYLLPFVYANLSIGLGDLATRRPDNFMKPKRWK